MGNDDDALAVTNEIVHDLDQLGNLLWGEGRSGLVQDQNISTAIQRLQDLNALLHADGNIFNLRVRVYGKTVTFGYFHHVLSRRNHVQFYAAGRLGPQNDILRDRKRLYQHEVLVYHADSGVDGIAGIVHLDLFAVNQDIAGCGLEQAVKLIHQCRLSCAVFAQNCVDFTFVDREVDAVIGDKIAEFFDDVAHLNNGRVHVHILFCQIDRPLSFK